MKSREEIQRRLNDMKNSPKSFETQTMIDYLEIALNQPEHWLKHLLMRYNFEYEEDEAIIKALEWVLEDER